MPQHTNPTSKFTFCGTLHSATIMYKVGVLHAQRAADLSRADIGMGFADN